jgi:sRNA-binding carbon storage regulator CsrA
MLVVRRMNSDYVGWQLRAGEDREGEDQIIVTTPDGQQIVFQVISVEGERVKVGIVAPPDHLITRAELKIRQQRAAHQGGYHGIKHHRQTYRH